MKAHTFVVTMLAALLAVLTLASSAWAECAWVLWHKDGGSESWIREDAFDVRTT